MTSAIILSIGDELTLGQTVDTNSAWISQQLASVGVKVVAHATVPDDQNSVEKAIRTCVGSCDVLLISGGLGPTEDDLTRQALAAVLQVPLELHEEAMRKLTAFFRSIKREMATSNKIQAMLPRGSLMIENTCGTAPGIRAALGPCNIFVMPGVPREMKAMFIRGILPELQQRTQGAVIVSRTLHTFGVGESNIGEMLGDLMKRGRNPSVGTTVSGGVVSVRVNSSFESTEKARIELDHISDACNARLGDLIYGQDEDTLSTTVASTLVAAKQTVATAESCTGGLLAKYLTDVPGSSVYFTQGWVTYSNSAKQKQLGVSAETLQQHGAVSEPVVLEMATGARNRSGADVALSISGVAGPDGGTESKPVGMVCIGLAHSGGAIARTFRFSGDRDFVRDRSAKMAMTLVRFHLLGKPLLF